MFSRFLIRLVLVVLSALASPLASAEPGQRVVIADGVATEIAFALGAGGRVVGVDQTSQYPQAARDKEQVGYFRSLSAEGILSLAPDLLIVSPFAGPPAVLEQIRAAGVSVVVMPDVERLEDVPAKVMSVGQAFGLEAKATAMADRLAADIAELQGSVPASNRKPKVLFVLSTRGGAPVVAGPETAPHAVIAAAGGENAMTAAGFLQMTGEALLASEPELLLMTDEHSAAAGGVASVLERPDLAGTPAGRDKRTLTLPALTVLTLGPRTPDAVRSLRERLSAIAAP